MYEAGPAGACTGPALASASAPASSSAPTSACASASVPGTGSGPAPLPSPPPSTSPSSYGGPVGLPYPSTPSLSTSHSAAAAASAAGTPALASSSFPGGGAPGCGQPPPQPSTSDPAVVPMDSTDMCGTAAGGVPRIGPPYHQIISSDFLGPGPLPPDRRIYLVVLNYHLPSGLAHVWSRATFRVCADGGVNRLHDQLPGMVPPPPEEVAAVAAEAEAAAAAADGGALAAAAYVASTYAPSTLKTTAPSSTAAENGNGIGGGNGNGNGRAAGPHRQRGPFETVWTSADTADTVDGNALASAVAAPSSAPSSSFPSAVPLPPATSASSKPHGEGPHHHPPYPPYPAPQRLRRSRLPPSYALRLAHLPDLVLGDLDSLRPDVRQFYAAHGVPFLDLSYDQDSTDLMKAIRLIEERFIATDADPSPERHQIIVLGALGGRLDHSLSNLNALHMFTHLNIALWGDGNLVRLVRPGGAVLIRADKRFEGPTCGLIPMAGPATASSTGLRWNLAGTRLEVGGLVSSSNAFDKRAGAALAGPAAAGSDANSTPGPGSEAEAEALVEVEVVTDAPLLWTTEVHSEPRPDLGALWARTEAVAARAEAAMRAQP
ncbi:hypothetical protein HYH03_019073 [Edaphochlamys debaryana]|uniref:thiamine diphosphokinase n=1 Tax=Edaphochlamys debaryana TaxID=47281 RepID=A0A835XE25_9CHLO|nr:hypothetical protein HYH03_019073 [Edaphochlamys debaryana]|eukprot:KAG2481966.1 hypothetical protein HYH03_019073 [Edaphochlamys debaryana]